MKVKRVRRLAFTSGIGGLVLAASFGPALAATTPSTTQPPPEPPPTQEEVEQIQGPGPGGLVRTPIATSSIVLYPAFLPDAFEPHATLSLDDALKAMGVAAPSRPARAFPAHPDPVTGGAPALTTTGGSLRVQFVPPAILGVLIAWAALTVFEFRRDEDAEVEGNAV